ncbi:glycoside hydrolase family 3 N-terminal domain-containing protein [Arthrobacter sp. GMC3]|uniref:glycoside hydrolase family 3 N-terminal domain-containing protein n=1 Tax=Arthrobacter sp. GMC3 TaxID=2058894 RepID=UPI000CE52D4B|nr:glycoside hydrolase family 3 N-terminal domain-containing protein [Arthrobacter sp. GMC3]
MTAPDIRRLAAGTLMPGFVGVSAPAWILEAFDDGLAAVCLFGTNLVSWEQLRELCGELRARAPHALLSVDEEGGDVTRLHYLKGSNQPGNAVLGRIADLAVTAASAAAIGAELASFGINLNLAPDADVNSAAENPVIGVRSFGASPTVVAAHTAAWIDGLQSAGVAACAKHFPGHGDTTSDSHLALPRVSVSAGVLEHRELVPFRAAAAVGAASIMTSHIVVDALDPVNPATFSRIVLQDVLRVQLGFTGAIVTDALDMVGASGEIGIPAAAVRALAAGADLLCIGSETSAELYEQVLDGVVAAVADGSLPVERLQDAAARTAHLATSYPATTGTNTGVAGSVPSADTIRGTFEISAKAHAWLADEAQAAVVQVQTQTNYAVGTVPWGPAATGATVAVESLSPGQKVAVTGRGLDPHHEAWEVANRLRAAGHHTIVIECGWPRGGADIVTYGASLAVSEALVGLLK